MLGWSLALGCGATPDGGVDDVCHDRTCSAGETEAVPPGADHPEETTDGESPDGDTADPSDEPTPADGDGIPCDVAAALQRACAECHESTPVFGAPMPLTRHEDFHLPSVTDPTQKVYALALARMADEGKPMPPGSEISDGDRTVIESWLAAGAPEDAEGGCGVDTPSDDDAGPDALPCDPDYVLTTHVPDGVEPYHVPAQGADDLYMCFAFESPFSEPTQFGAFAPIIDDERVIHHWILYRSKEQHPDRSVFPCDVGLQLSADFVAGWAPGQGGLVAPDDVGVELGGPDDTFILQVHYHNTANYEDAFDQSGLAFCTLEEPREKLAGYLTLGRVNLEIPAGAQMLPQTGTCGFLSTAFWPEPVHILAGSPHMHELGRAFRTDLVRGDGSRVTVTDVPNFDFNFQKSYPLEPEVVVNPGETLETTCYFTNETGQTVYFGEGTGDEMCFNFVLAYPIDSLPDRNCGILF